MNLEPTHVAKSHRPRTRELQLGEIVAGRYRVVGRIADGGMGEVYKVEHVELGRTFAMKVMKRELSQDAEFVARFKREAVAATTIGHQNIVDITDFGRTAEGRFYFVMEYLDGETLTARLKRKGALDVSEVLQLGAQICRALSTAHQLGIVHRDLKPENVMVLSRPGQPDLVKVVDFGVAKVSSMGQGGHTAIGMVMGTPQYMSPEQAAGLRVDHKSDIYSLGLIFYELLSGRPVFQGQTPSVLMALQMTEPPPPLQRPQGRGELHPQVEQLLFAMLEKRPEHRPESLEQVLEVIDALRPKTGYTPAVTRLAPRTGPVPALSSETIARPLTAEFPVDVSLTPATPIPAVVVAAPAPAPFVRFGTVLGAVASIAFGAAVAFGVMLALEAQAPAPQPPIVIVPQPQPEPLPVPAPARVKITLETAPTGAEVYEGDVLVGTTPTSITRKKGDVIELRFTRRGFQQESRRVAVDEQRTVTIAMIEQVVVAKKAPVPAPAPAPAKKPALAGGLKPSPW